MALVTPDDAEEFPLLPGLSSTRKKYPTPSWGNNKKSFKEIVEKNKITFDYDILEKRKDEKNVTYFNRLSDIFKQTTILHKYDIYTVKSKNKSYRVAARHEIIARFLCQVEENKNSRKAHADAYNKFRQNILDQIRVDDELWEFIMERVEGDSSRCDEAIRLYYNETPASRFLISLDWLDPNKTSCEKDSENHISEEKILY